MRWQWSARLRTASAALAVMVLAGAALLASHVADRPVAAVRARSTASTGGVDPVRHAGHGLPWAWALYVGIIVALVGSIVWFAARDGLLAVHRGDDEQGPSADGDDTRRRTAAALGPAREQALTDAVDALTAGAEPREVVIACWVRLEEAAAAVGQGRGPAETATDVARRWLAHTDDRAAVDVLAGLFHEARYSEHPLTDEHRARALDALRRVSAQPGRATRQPVTVAAAR